MRKTLLEKYWEKNAINKVSDEIAKQYQENEKEWEMIRKEIIRKAFLDKVEGLPSEKKQRSDISMEKNKDILCSSCLHRDVCKLKDKYLTIHNRIVNLDVIFHSPIYVDGHDTVKLKDIEWISPLRPICTHYLVDYNIK